MTFQDITGLALSIKPLKLEVLVKDSESYTTLVYQPVGVFQESAEKFGNADAKVAHAKMMAFLEIGRERDASLVITPEYSCPWTVLHEILTSGFLPDEGKLWVICCESITKTELIGFRDKYQNNSTIVYFEDSVLSSKGTFLDPVCYILKVRDETSNELKSLVLIQFKTQHMSVRNSQIERDNYIAGDRVYILKNSNTSIHLITLVCSDVVNFSIDENVRDRINWDNNPYLILHPQLNPNPKHHLFTDFRRWILNWEKKEIMSVNWSSHSTIVASDGVSTKPFMQYSRSAIYTKNLELDEIAAKQIDENHLKGMFYCFNPPKAHVFYLCKEIEIFEILNQKVDQSGIAAPMQGRRGPSVRQIYSMNKGKYELLPNYDSLLNQYLDEQKCTSSFLRRSDVSTMDKERVINLSAASIVVNKQMPWYSIENLQSLRLDSQETIRRLTFFQDDDADSRSKRNEARATVNYLNGTIIPAGKFPSSIGFLVGLCDEIKFDYTTDNEKFLYNLISRDGKHKATIAFVGEQESDVVNLSFNTLIKLFPQDNNASRKVVVWYTRGGAVLFKAFKNPPGPATDPAFDINSITSLEK